MSGPTPIPTPKGYGAFRPETRANLKQKYVDNCSIISNVYNNPTSNTLRLRNDRVVTVVPALERVGDFAAFLGESFEFRVTEENESSEFLVHDSSDIVP
jgi:hypothetical protein